MSNLRKVFTQNLGKLGGCMEILGYVLIFAMIFALIYVLTIIFEGDNKWE